MKKTVKPPKTQTDQKRERLVREIVDAQLDQATGGACGGCICIRKAC
jgi:hypothetical protein